MITTHIAEVDGFAVGVGQFAVVHDLQQDIEQVRVRFFDLVEQQNTVRLLINRVREQTALIKTHIARWCANQTGNRVPLHVFRHVEANKLNTHGVRQLLGHLSFTNAGWTREQERANGLFWFAQTGTRQFHAVDKASIASSWP